MMRRLLLLGSWPVLAAAMLATAHLIINTTLMLYDDEGYVLLSLRDYLAGGRLYDEIFTQYGPWPFVYHQLVTAVLAEPLTHSLGRWLTAVHWTGCGLLAGATALRLTGRPVAALATGAAVFSLLWQMNAEPTHPGSLIAVLVAGAVYAMARLPALTRPDMAAVWLGLTTALLCLTKINVGLLLLAGIGAAALRYTAWPQSWIRPAAIAALVGLLLVPWGLMGRKLDEPWVLLFALQFTLGAGLLLWVTPPTEANRRLPPRLWLVAAAAGLFTVLAVGTLVCLRGTSPAALLDAVLISPLRHPANFMFGFSWVPESWVVSVAGALLAARAGWELRRHGALQRATQVVVILARLAALGYFFWHLQTWLTIYGVGRFITVCLPLLPLFVIPLRPQTESAGTPALWLAAFVALPQILHAFPVAGSQMGWATFAFVPLFAAGLHEVWEVLAPALPRLGRRLGPISWAALLAATGWQLWLLGHNGWQHHQVSKPLGLAGAEGVRITGPIRESLRILTLNASLHADVLFSRPGMFSYNLWSGVPTPTTRNATHWFWLLDAADQQRIIDRLEATPRSAIIVNHPNDEFVRQHKIPVVGPLYDYIETHYRTLFQTGYSPHTRDHILSFLVPRESRAVPFGKIEALTRDGAESADGRPMLLRANLVLDGQPVTVRLARASCPWRLLHDFTAAGSEIFLEPINAEGTTFGAPMRLAQAGPLRGLYRITIMTESTPSFDRLHDAVLEVLDAQGLVLAEALY
ncbi:MAG: hypothetical protein KIT44_09095 [Opitutaceae bacterium]|nr:hypothetical protein [Opitutaceae bacterium]